MPTKNSRTASTFPTEINTLQITKYNSWITSGKLGSRDCVLVFRTKILNAQRPSLKIANSVDASDPTTVDDTKSNDNRKSDSVFDCDRSSSDPSIFNISNPIDGKSPLTSRGSQSMSIDSKTKEPSSHSQTKNINPHCTNVKVVAPSITKVHLSTQKTYGKTHEYIKPEAVKKLMNASLSSSDTSISSEYDEPIDLSKPTRALPGDTISVEDTEQDDTQTIEDDNDDDDDNDRAYYEVNCPFMPHMPAAELKITYKFVSCETKLLRRIFVRHGLLEVEEGDRINILWTGVHMRPDILRNLAPYQRVNHFPRSYELTRKDRLYKNIAHMQRLRGLKHFDIVPQSFVLPLEYRDLVTTHNKQRGPWIVKPAASSRGRGIFIVTSPDQIPQEEQVLVSKYIADPLCIDGHKCDVRVYVLVTSFDPLIIYLYEEGLVRLATVKYDRNADNLWNPCMHLCNYSINKYHTDYIKSSDAHEEDVGHKWTFSALLRHLKLQGCDTSTLMLHIEDLIIKSILACSQSIISACRMFVPNGNNCFELYGFDILIDDMLKPWLLEVNLSPSMCVDSPLDTKVKACLIADLLTCVGIPAYTAPMREHYDKKWTRFRGTGRSRHTNSADTLSGNRRQQSTKVQLTSEEQRIIRSARQQNERRGGFVRIYPTFDTMQRYGQFLDPATGIPLASSGSQSQTFFSTIMPHNYNQLLYDNLYGKNSKENGANEGNLLEERMDQYERPLESGTPVKFPKKKQEPKCEEECKRLRHQIIKLISSGSELTQLQARQTFALYLQAVLRRLPQETRDLHEKLILRFVTRAGGGIKAPVSYRNPQKSHIISKAHSAMTAKLLGDFLEQYNRDTDAYIDTFDHYGMVPSGLYNEFLAQAQEADLEKVLVLVTNVTGAMPYLYNRCGLSVPPTPPIPTGLHGFLKALPSMVVGGPCTTRELNNLIKVNEKKNCEYNEPMRSTLFF